MGIVEGFVVVSRAPRVWFGVSEPTGYFPKSPNADYPYPETLNPALLAPFPTPETLSPNIGA